MSNAHHWMVRASSTRRSRGHPVSAAHRRTLVTAVVDLVGAERPGPRVSLCLPVVEVLGQRARHRQRQRCQRSGHRPAGQVVDHRSRIGHARTQPDHAVLLQHGAGGARATGPAVLPPKSTRKHRPRPQHPDRLVHRGPPVVDEVQDVAGQDGAEGSRTAKGRAVTSATHSGNGARPPALSTSRRTIFAAMSTPTSGTPDGDQRQGDAAGARRRSPGPSPAPPARRASTAVSRSCTSDGRARVAS